MAQPPGRLTPLEPARSPASIERHGAAAVAFLAEATQLLNESLDPPQTLAMIARLAARELADWCSVDLLDDDERLVRLSVVASDPADAHRASEFEERPSTDFDLPFGPRHVVTTKQPQLIGEITDDMLEQSAVDADDLEMLRGLGLRSAMIVPLEARGRVLGTITFVSAASGRTYTTADLALATELAHRAAMALDNAQLYSATSEAEQRLRSLVDDVDGILWEIRGGSLSYTFVSEHAEKLLGYRPSDWTADGFRASLIHKHDIEHADACLRRAMTGAGDCDVEYRAHAADGRLLWLRDIVHAGNDSGGPVLRGLSIDITRRKIEELRTEAVREVASVLAGARSLEEAAEAVLEAIAIPLSWDIGEMWLADGDTLHCHARWLAADVRAPAFLDESADITFERGVGLPGQVLESVTPRWIKDVHSHRGFVREAAAAEAGLTTAIAFPIMAGSEASGVLVFFGTDPRDPDEDLLATVAAVGSQIGQFVERMRAEAALRFYVALLSAHSDSSLEATFVISPDGKLAYHNKRILELIGTTDERIRRATVEDVAGIASRWIIEPKGLLDSALLLHESRERQSRMEVTTRDGRAFDVWSTPLYGSGGVFHGRAWYIRDISERKQNEQMLRQAKERFEFLAGASTLLGAGQDFDNVLGQAASLIVQFMSDACVAISRSKDQSARVVACVAHAARDEAALVAALQDTDEAGLLSPDSPQILDLERRQSPAAAALRELGFTSALVLPLHERGGRQLGSLAALRRARFTEADLRLAEIFARRAALAADNARLYQERAYVAQALQAGLLPPDLPTIDGGTLAARYRPSGEVGEVGGDFYDVFPTGSESWGLVIGDACGKGAEAASLTALVRYTIRAVAMSARRPSRILAPLNDAIIQQRGDYRYCTVACARVTQTDGGLRVTVCLGGHPPALVIRADGAVEQFGARGTLLGLFPDPELVDRRIDLAPGDALVLYTDGVTEARGPDGIFGVERLMLVAGGFAAQSADAIADGIEQAVLDHQRGDLPRDDVALLVLRAD